MKAALNRAVVFLSVWLCVCQVRGLYIPQEMNRTLQNLRQHYKISNQELYNGKNVFSREPLKGKIESKMLFMGGVLETYEKLIEHMLNQLPTPSPLITQNKEKPSSSITDISRTSSDETAGDIGSKLAYILGKIQELKKHRYQEQMKVLHGLQNLRHIKMDSPAVQSKALFELPWFFEEASTLADTVMRKRRRRQARVKLHQRS
ncbi:interferon gamma 1 [Nematolebias whitei]|uniref:interferon gamma 1 n=1 Tax=Nematolebias whitei TaxID=451745 RepID=UPI00189C2D54|nr:interferon gamma 1 [Nematolebias whitei]